MHIGENLHECQTVLCKNKEIFFKMSSAEILLIVLNVIKSSSSKTI